MGSKSILILGIVFIFLLNVVAVHNYIGNYYYQPEKIKDISSKDFKTSIDEIILDSDIKDQKISLQNIEENSSFIIKTNNKIKNKNQKEDIQGYKNQNIDNFNNNDISKSSINDSNNSNTIKKDKKELDKDQDNKDEKNAFIVLNLNINDPYQHDNPIVKKIVNRFDEKKVIKIKIYKYSMKIKNYLEDIKSNLVDYGIDIDDIKVIYKKDKRKQDTIKILLTKKD